MFEDFSRIQFSYDFLRMKMHILMVISLWNDKILTSKSREITRTVQENGKDIKDGDVDTAQLLNLFAEWTAGSALPANDNRVLLTGRDFHESTVGLAFLNKMCTNTLSASINMCIAPGENVAAGTVNF